MLNDQSITSPRNEPQGSTEFALFVSPQNDITNSSGEFGLEENSTECKVSVLLVTTLLCQLQPYHLYIS